MVNHTLLLCCCTFVRLFFCPIDFSSWFSMIFVVGMTTGGLAALHTIVSNWWSLTTTRPIVSICKRGKKDDRILCSLISSKVTFAKRRETRLVFFLERFMGCSFNSCTWPKTIGFLVNWWYTIAVFLSFFFFLFFQRNCFSLEMVASKRAKRAI